MDETTDAAERPTGPEGLRSKATNAFKWSLAAQLLARGGGFAIGLILARLLVPKEFGTYTLALGVYTILLTVDDLGLRQGLVRFTGSFEDATKTALTVSAVTGVLTYGIAFAIAPVVAEVTSSPGVTGVIRFLCLGLIIDSALHIVPSAALQREFRQDLGTVTELAGLLVDFIVTILLARAGLGAWALAWGSLAGQLVKSLVALRLSRVHIRYGYHRELARELMRVSAPYAIASFVGALLLNIDYLIVGNVLGSVAVGLYLIAFNVSSWPTSLVGTAVRAVAIPGFARIREERGDVAGVFSRGLVLLTAGAMPFIALLTSIPGTLIEGLYGARWGAGAPALQFLGLLALMRLLGGLADDLLFALGRSSWILMKNLLWIATLAPAIAIGAHVGGLRGVGIAQAVIAGGLILPALVWTTRRIGVWRSDILSTLLPLLPAAGVRGSMGWAIDRSLSAPPIARPAVAGTAEMLTYCCLLIPLRHRLYPRRAPVMA